MRLATRAAVLCLLLVSMAGADPYDTDGKLRSSYGYLVIDTVVARPVTEWRLDEDFVIERLPQGRQTLLIRLKSGGYHWRELNIPYFDLPHELDVSDDHRWRFRVDPQKINYAGTLIVDEQRASDSVDVRFINRASEIPDILREQYPVQLAEFELVFSGWYRDDYLELLDSDDAPAQ